MDSALAFGHYEALHPSGKRRKHPEPDGPELDFGEPIDALCARLFQPRPLPESEPQPE